MIEQISSSHRSIGFTPQENKHVTIPDNPEARKIVDKINYDPNQGDWMSTNSVVFPGQPKSSEFHKQVEVKLGEDNILYAAFCGPGYGSLINGYFYFYKSTNFGLNWSYVYGVGTGTYMGDISLLVESKNNSHPDSTRLILFYTSTFDSNYTGAQLQYFSLRANASAITSGTISSPTAGNTYSHLSSVTDGAFWQGATFFGVVVSESNNVSGNIVQTRFFRTINWGETWASSVLNTSFNDFYPSAAYKEGSTDSIYIAFERRFSETNSDIRVLATPWSPTSSFHVYYLTNSSSLYEKPCLNIKQNNPVDSVLITCTKNGVPLYHVTSNGGGQWSIDYSLGISNGSNKSYTFCSSSASGPNAFSACWISSDGDSINVRRGVLGSMGNTIYKVNSNPSLVSTMPVCATIALPTVNNTVAVYASTSPNGIYSTQEGLKSVNIKIIPQGFYNASTNRLSMKDTITLFVRNNFSPYNIADSCRSIVDSTGYNAFFQFTGLNDGTYYLAVEHRNFLETWSSSTVSLSITTNSDYNFTVDKTLAYGSNQIQVDASPLRYAVYSGDVNQDGVIDGSDASLADNDAFNFATGYVVTDVTGDNVVDGSDAAVIGNNAFNFVSKITP